MGLLFLCCGFAEKQSHTAFAPTAIARTDGHPAFAVSQVIVCFHNKTELGREPGNGFVVVTDEIGEMGDFHRAITVGLQGDWDWVTFRLTYMCLGRGTGMYFFYFDESGSRDPDCGGEGRPLKDPLYVLFAIGLWEGHWHKLDRAISNTKLELAGYLRREGKGQFQLADCEVKSNWIRNAKERSERSPFLHALNGKDRESLVAAYFHQLPLIKAVMFAVVIDKRHLRDHVTHETLHKKAYELILERIENFMGEYHPKHNALIVMDDTSLQLNRAVAMKHAYFQRSGNQNVRFRHIIEYPFFTRSELSNGVQLADLCAYNVYRTFTSKDFSYPYFELLLPYFYKRAHQDRLDGLKVWPEGSELIDFARAGWAEYQKNCAAGQADIRD